MREVGLMRDRALLTNRQENNLSQFYLMFLNFLDTGLRRYDGWFLDSRHILFF